MAEQDGSEGRPGRLAGDSSPAVVRPEWWLWFAGAVLVALILAYVGAVVIDDLPPSPARQALVPLADHVVNPWFEQQWTLFAPTPPTANARLYMVVRYLPGTAEASCHPVDLSTVYLDMAKTQRWAPSRLYRVTMDIAVEIDQVVEYQHPNTPATNAIVDNTAATQSEANVYLAPSALGTEPLLTQRMAHGLRLAIDGELQRLLSSSARSLCPRGRSIAAVKGIETVQAIAPYSDPHLREPQIPIFSTGWLAYIRDVAP